MKNIFSKILILSIALFTFSYSFAQPVAATISGDQSVHVGDRVRVYISYNTSGNLPIYTASADVKYDSTALSFSDVSFSSDWLPISKAPYEITEAGHIVRTAGFPSGLTGSSRFVTLSFVAKKAGSTNINLVSGMALDENNNDLGISGRTLSVNVIGDEPVPTVPVKPTSQPVAKTETKNPTEEVKPVIREQVVKGNNFKIDTEDLPEGNYVVTIKQVSPKKGGTVVEKNIQVIKNTSTTTEPATNLENKNISIFVKIINFLKVFFSF